jgi:hypothetical protein
MRLFVVLLGLGTFAYVSCAVYVSASSDDIGAPMANPSLCL